MPGYSLATVGLAAGIANAAEEPFTTDVTVTAITFCAP